MNERKDESWIWFLKQLFSPMKRPQTKLVASWQPEKDQLVPCRLRGLKIKRQKKWTILWNDAEKKYLGGQKKDKANLDWNGMRKENLEWKGFLDSIYVFPRKRYASNSYFIWKQLTLDTQFWTRNYFCLSSLYATKTDCLRHCSMKRRWSR